MKPRSLFIIFIFAFVIQVSLATNSFCSTKYSDTPIVGLLKIQEDVFSAQRRLLTETAKEILGLNDAELNRRIRFLGESSPENQPGIFSELTWTQVEPILKLDKLFQNEKLRFQQERHRLANMSFQKRLKLLRNATGRLQELESQNHFPNTEISEIKESGGYREGTKPLTLDAVEVQKLIEQILILRDVDSSLPYVATLSFDFIHFIALASVWIAVHIHAINTHSNLKPLYLTATAASGIALFAYEIYLTQKAKAHKTPGSAIGRKIEAVQIQVQQRRQTAAEPQILAGLQSYDLDKLSVLYGTLTKLSCQMALLPTVALPSAASTIETEYDAILKIQANQNVLGGAQVRIELEVERPQADELQDEALRREVAQNAKK